MPSLNVFEMGTRWVGVQMRSTDFLNWVPVTEVDAVSRVPERVPVKQVSRTSILYYGTSVKHFN